jgi:hypothetical protein
MSETITLADDFNPFDDTIVAQPPVESPVEPPVESPAEPIEPTTTTEPQPQDYSSFLKENFGFDSVEDVKGNLNKEPSFDNEISKTLYKAIKSGNTDEVFNVIQEQKKINDLLDGEIDENKASEIIKINLKTKYSDLTDDEINLLMSEKYKTPTKPEKGEFDDDDIYDELLSDWKKELSNYNKKMIIDAKIAKPELEKLKQEIKLPDIDLPYISSEKESEELRKAREVYEQSLNNDYKDFSGFTVNVTDGEKETPISFSVSDEEKSQLKEILSDFNPDEFLYKRWFSEEGKPLVKQMMSDVYLLQNQAKILQKIGNEAASQRELQKIKESGQVSVGTTPQRTVTQSDTAAMDSLVEWAFGS